MSTTPSAIPDPKSGSGAAARSLKEDTGGSDEQTASFWLRNAEWVAFWGLVVCGLIWLAFMPFRTRCKYDLPTETELCSRIIQAQVRASGSTIAQAINPAGCPSLNAQNERGAITSKSSFYRPHAELRMSYALASIGPPQQNVVPDPVEELRADLIVWNRYEDELKTFQWGKDLNWYIYSSLRTLVILLSAITPALIVAPIFKDRKFLSVLPAAIVAIGTGCISEFNFREEAAAYTDAFVQVQGEKTAFVTRCSPFYHVSSSDAQSKSPGRNASNNDAANSHLQKASLTQTALSSRPVAQSTRQEHSGTPKSTKKGADKGVDRTKDVSPSLPLRGCSRDGEVPFPNPLDYPEFRANFACRLQQIWQGQNGERLLYLRAGQPQKQS